ncbi:hypothetical protein ACLOJK_038990 [Asimina triloba]
MLPHLTPSPSHQLLYSSTTHQSTTIFMPPVRLSTPTPPSTTPSSFPHASGHSLHQPVRFHQKPPPISPMPSLFHNPATHHPLHIPGRLVNSTLPTTLRLPSSTHQPLAEPTSTLISPMHPYLSTSNQLRHPGTPNISAPSEHLLQCSTIIAKDGSHGYRPTSSPATAPKT